MLHLSSTGSDGRWQWTLVRFTDCGAEVLACGARIYPTEESCRAAARLLCYTPLAAMLAVQQPDGRWRWLLLGDDGHPVAESPITFGDAASCGRVLVEVQQDLKSLAPA
jgi:hypothetical protein